MAVQHDSLIRSDWLPLGLTRAKAITFAAVLEGRLRAEGTINAHNHLGRNYRDRDVVAVTAPAGWRTGHGGSHTVKTRGCAAFRDRCRAIGMQLAAEASHTWDGRDLSAAPDAMSTGAIDSALIALKGQRGSVRTRSGATSIGTLGVYVDEKAPFGQRLFVRISGTPELRINLQLVDRIDPA
jgi:hypothetical protein